GDRRAPSRGATLSRGRRSAAPLLVRLGVPSPPAYRPVSLAAMEAGAGVTTVLFADRLAEAVERKRSQLVVGLDPRLALLPVELRGEAAFGRADAAAALERFCCGIVDATAPYVVAVKPQVAFFEALGADGIRALEAVCDYARAADLLVIVDAKRGDIGSTARAYAAAYLEP